MSTQDIAYINGTIVERARERLKLEPSVLAESIGKGLSAQHIEAWESGRSFPTFSQAEKLADSLRIPFAVLFMEVFPDISVPLPDLRTINGKTPGPLSVEFFDTVSEALVRQYWYRDYRRREHHKPLPFVGKFSLGDDINSVAHNISTTLHIDDQLRSSISTWQAFLTKLIELVEEAGILVMVNSLVQHSTKRPLSLKEFRGFASTDAYAPLVFLNGRDARAAMIFTLIHEVAHIWINQGGISSPDPLRRWSDFSNPIERYCNAVAAQVLIPEDNFHQFWKKYSTTEERIAKVSSFHRVSKIVTIIRARELNVVSYEKSQSLINTEMERYTKQKEKQKDKDTGPNFWMMFPSRNSARLTAAVVRELAEGHVMFRDAANLLGTKVGVLEKYVSKKAG